MHILIIPSWYKTSSQPLLGSFFEEQARGLMAQGHRVGVLLPNFYPLKYFFKSKSEDEYTINDNGLPTYSYAIQSLLPGSRTLNYYYLGVASKKKFEEYVRQNGMPDVLHAHTAFHAGIVASFLSKKYNVPFVITEHLTHYITGGIDHPVDIKFAQKVFTLADAAITVSTSFKHSLAKSLHLDPAVFRVVYNTVSNHFFENIKPRPFTPGEEFIFFTNSFLNERKNHELAFKALKIMIDKGYKVKLNIGGYGEYEGELRKISSTLGIAGQINFLGSLSRNEVKNQMDLCHAFLLPSKFETFGVVAIESLACGRPVIATDSGGPQDIIRENNGILVKSFEPENFAQAMEYLIQHYNQYDANVISQYCYNHFSQEEISNQLVAIYKEVIEKRTNKAGC